MQIIKEVPLFFKKYGKSIIIYKHIDMKTELLILSIFLAPFFGISQSIEKYSIDSGGASALVGDVQVLYTIGEVNVQELAVGDIQVSEGFINPTPAAVPGLLFITKWVVAAGETITIPTTGGGYDYNVDWSYDTGDGFQSESSNVTGNATSPVLTAGEYTVAISGDFPRIYFNNSGDKNKITEIVQWGTNPWTSMERAFAGCSNLNITNLAVGVPDLSSVTSIRRMFYQASSFNADIGNWDVSNVKKMDFMFFSAKVFNQDISSWNTGSAINMSGMFSYALAFNQDISGWNTSGVTNMSRMFSQAIIFDQNLGTWDLSKMTSMQDMFLDAELSTSNYDATLIGWADDTSGNLSDGTDDIPTNITFSGGDSGYCTGEIARNLLTAALPTPTGYGWTITDGGLVCGDPVSLFITKWVVLAGETITIPTKGSGYDYNVDWSYDAGNGFMADAGSMNVTGDLTSPVLTAGEHTVAISGDFPRIYFNQSGDKDKITEIVAWGTNPWTSMERAFAGCSNLNITNLAVGVPDLSSVTSIRRMFYQASSFNADIGNWDVSNVKKMDFMFFSAKVFNQDISSWNTGSAINMSGMFSYALAFNQDISGWNTSGVTNMSRMFSQAIIFDQNLGTWDLSKMTSMQDMFLDAELSTSNYDATLIGWADDTSGNLSDGTDDIPTNITFSGGDSGYCTGEIARNLLTAALPTPTGYGWTITDGGLVCSTSLAPVVLGVNDSNLDLVSLYPNPTQNIVTIVSPKAIVTSAAIYDIRGRKVSQVDFRNQTNYKIDLSDMEAAVYFINIATENGTVTKRVIKHE
jgi:surface protein